ncbi:MarR family winged helix-turn-helix transcriptional regulator [Treponema zioleckii]|uniref:MarR family winged helix-turn-helix transcriptional regulator n=1 Tax=Treponema zioleckii TaxID=331680 RepID=UPI00168AE877|nr:MarR family transcriptional regulator [Treponema zioleckii]
MKENFNEKDFSCLQLKNQLCFPLYAASREILRKYTPFLKEIGLTYTQYIVMMVMWERKKLTIGELGKQLFLDTGTLSPLLKSMQEKGLLTRCREKNDERIVNIEITQVGEELKEKAVSIPEKVGSCIKLDAEDAKELYRILYRILDKV